MTNLRKILCRVLKCENQTAKRALDVKVAAEELSGESIALSIGLREISDAPDPMREFVRRIQRRE